MNYSLCLASVTRAHQVSFFPSFTITLLHKIQLDWDEARGLASSIFKRENYCDAMACGKNFPGKNRAEKPLTHTLFVNIQLYFDGFLLNLLFLFGFTALLFRFCS